MIKKKFTKLVGLKKEEFDFFVLSGQIQLQSARLIPVLKTGDEMALTSIFLSSLKLIKEFRDGFFKEIGLSRNGKIYYYTEAKFKDLSPARIDGLIIVVVKGKIADAAFLEMKAGKNSLEKKQLEKYIEISKKLKVGKLVTVSNEFVANSSQSPVKVKTPKSVVLSHFSWTYLITKGQLLLFKNDTNIEDRDQVEIMKEVLYYFESPQSGIRGYSQMKVGWKELAENVHAQKPLKQSDDYIKDAVLSWHEEEKSMCLLLSRKLGVFVKPFSKSDDRLKNDIKKIVKENYIVGGISVKDAVSNIKIKADFERRVISMSIKVIPPQNKSNSARMTWIANQFKNCYKRSEYLFEKHKDDIWIESNIKFMQENSKVRFREINSFSDTAKTLNDIQAFHVSLVKSFGSKFASQKKIIELMEEMLVEYYECIVQHMTSWKKPAPKIVEVEREIWEKQTPQNNLVQKSKEIDVEPSDEKELTENRTQLGNTIKLKIIESGNTLLIKSTSDPKFYNQKVEGITYLNSNSLLIQSLDGKGVGARIKLAWPDKEKSNTYEIMEKK